MKKLRLRKEVKKILLVIIGLGLLLGVLVLDNVYTERTIQTCINNGVDKNICEELRK